jgi:sulfoxide reductase heme-binding subunit YedZ
MAAWLLLIPLAITSTHKMVQRLGGKKWLLLHKLVYPIAIGAILHYALLIKAGWSLAAPYIVTFIILMAIRLTKLHLIK